jgi:hypothetical protein
MSRGILSVFLLLAVTSSVALAHAQDTRFEDRSDWWSILNEGFQGPKVKPGNKDLHKGNFQIAGVALSGDQFKELAIKLGQTTAVVRGDASSGRHQVCYESVDDATRVHLVFEFGEVEETFYLFAGGPDWNGSDLCTKSKLVSTALSTPSGLRLGLARSQVETILGTPDAVIGDRLVYSREYKKKTSTEEFEQMRNDYPRKVDDKEAHEMFDFYDVGIYIEARLTDSKLAYLAVSRTETD